MNYVMDSISEGQRIERKTDKALTVDQLSWAGIGHGQRVLDLGCAAGTTARIMAELTGPTGHVVGIDASEQRIVEAQNHPQHHRSIEYRQGEAGALPARDAEFDVSWSRFLFEYLLDPKQALSEMVRVTKPGGIVAISDLDGNCIWHDPAPADFTAELYEAVSTLSKNGFDPNVGRKLYHLACAAGLKEIEVDVRPYHVVAGRIDAESESLWRLKLDTVSHTLVRLGWDQVRVNTLIEHFLSHLQDERSFTYSVMITVKGRRP